MNDAEHRAKYKVALHLGRLLHRDSEWKDQTNAVLCQHKEI